MLVSIRLSAVLIVMLLLAGPEAGSTSGKASAFPLWANPGSLSIGETWEESERTSLSFPLTAGGSATPVQKFPAQPSPRMVLEKYLEVLRLHIKDPYLGLYTAESRSILRGAVITDAQQDRELHQLQALKFRARIYEEGRLAVIRFPLEYREASPYFLRSDGRRWMIDFASMSRIIGFNSRNQWFFRNTEHPFMFAFVDLVFDRNGFPQSP